MCLSEKQRLEFKKAKELFDTKLMKNYAEEDFDLYPIMCEIHNAFESLNDGSTKHNCIGCNFADSTWLIKYFLDRVDNYESIHDAYFEYIFRIYLLAERMQEVFSIIELPDKYRLKHFFVLQKITRWANFVKHPKGFIYTHHPIFVIEGEDTTSIDNPLLIDDDFVKKYYSGGKNNKVLFDKLSNNPNVIVCFPNPLKIMSEIIDACILFISVVCENEVYKEILAEHSTFEEYFEVLDNENE